MSIPVYSSLLWLFQACWLPGWSLQASPWHEPAQNQIFSLDQTCQSWQHPGLPKPLPQLGLSSCRTPGNSYQHKNTSFHFDSQVLGRTVWLPDLHSVPWDGPHQVSSSWAESGWFDLERNAGWIATNLMATSLKPFCSNLFTISPTSPRWSKDILQVSSTEGLWTWTPSGLIMMKVLSAWAPASAFSWNGAPTTYVYMGL